MIKHRDCQGQTPLHYAAAAGHEIVLKTLLSTFWIGSDLEGERKRTPLWCATDQGYGGVPRQLVHTRKVDTGHPAG